MGEQSRVTDAPKEGESVTQTTDAESPGEAEVTPGALQKDVDEESVRRPLIRATLKHTEGMPPLPRTAPVFTMHQQDRGGGGSGRGLNRNGRFARDSGHSNQNQNHQNQKKSSRDRPGHTASMKGGSSGKKRSSRSEHGGQQRTGSDHRSSQSRRDKGRSR